MEASRDFRAVSFSSPIIVDCGSGCVGRDPKMRPRAGSAAAVCRFADSAGSRTGIVDDARLDTRPET